MRKLTSATALGLTLLLASQPASADAPEECRTATSAERRLAACSEVISGNAFTPDQKAAAYRNRGRARADAGALDQAIADLSEAIRLNAVDHQAFIYRALARLGRNDPDGALADYDEVIRLRPNSSIGYAGRGHVHLVKGNGEKAIADYTTVLQLNPQSPSGHNNRGLAYKLAGDARRAIDDYTKAIAINPIYALAYANRGSARESLGLKTEAISDYRSALTIDTSLTAAKEGLRRLGSSGPLAEESNRLIADGKALVEVHCKGCHAVGATGASPNPKAPEFRLLQTRHPMLALREPLTRGIAAPHDEMPKFRLPDSDIDKVIAYINSLEVKP